LTPETGTPLPHKALTSITQPRIPRIRPRKPPLTSLTPPDRPP
jgi:hypothetical protein